MMMLGSVHCSVDTGLSAPQKSIDGKSLLCYNKYRSNREGDKMQMNEQKFVCRNAAKYALIAYIILTVLMVGFAAALFLGAFRKGVDAAVHICVGAVILGIWLLLTVGCCRNSYYLHLKYSCTAEGIINSIRNQHRMLQLSEGVFCTCAPVKFYIRYGYITGKFYLFSNKPFDRNLDDYAGAVFIRKIWEDQMFLMPVCADTTDWIQSTYGCENLAEYPKATYFPPKG